LTSLNVLSQNGSWKCFHLTRSKPDTHKAKNVSAGVRVGDVADPFRFCRRIAASIWKRAENSSLALNESGYHDGNGTAGVINRLADPPFAVSSSRKLGVGYPVLRMCSWIISTMITMIFLVEGESLLIGLAVWSNYFDTRGSLNSGRNGAKSLFAKVANEVGRSISPPFRSSLEPC
jgi:hypothetical protein